MTELWTADTQLMDLIMNPATTSLTKLDVQKSNVTKSLYTLTVVMVETPTKSKVNLMIA